MNSYIHFQTIDSLPRRLFLALSREGRDDPVGSGWVPTFMSLFVLNLHSRAHGKFLLGHLNIKAWNYLHAWNAQRAIYFYISRLSRIGHNGHNELLATVVLGPATISGPWTTWLLALLRYTA